MHELGIVFQIIKGVEKTAKENGLTKVASVTVELGEVSTVIPHYLTDCWRWAADKNDLTREAELLICPHCGSEKTWLLQGNQVMIKEIEGC